MTLKIIRWGLFEELKQNYYITKGYINPKRLWVWPTWKGEGEQAEDTKSIFLNFDLTNFKSLDALIGVKLSVAMILHILSSHIFKLQMGNQV